MQEAMARIHREGYNAVIDAAKATMQAVRTYKKKLPDGDYSGLEATAEFLLDVLDVHEKCRIVIEYDPAEERTAIYRTEFEGKPITFNEYWPDQNEKSDGNHGSYQDGYFCNACMDGSRVPGRRRVHRRAGSGAPGLQRRRGKGCLQMDLLGRRERDRLEDGRREKEAGHQSPARSDT